MIRITGGKVFDPANNLHGVIRDVCIQNGKIVDDLPSRGRTLDATGLVIFPGGVDAHTHVAGSSLNFARGLLPEHLRNAHPIIRDQICRAGWKSLTPTTFATGYVYAGMGWTTVNEAAVAALSARHTHEELRDTPMVDKTFCILMANNEILLDLLQAGEPERARHLLAWYIRATQAYGVKAVNPGGVVAWKAGRAGKDAQTLHQPVPGYHRVTPGHIVAALARFCDELHLPHPVHLHCNDLGAPGNVATTLETIRLLEGHRAHLAHLQFHAYGGSDWESFCSGSTRIAEVFNASPNLTADVGLVLFGPAVTISADSPWQHLLHQLTGKKWGNIDVENETGCGIVPYVYKEKNLVNAVQWAVGLELLLLIDDPWRIALTTDHPNGAPFWRYPEIIRLLMDRDFRQEQIARIPDPIRRRMILPDLDRVYTLSEIAIIQSAGPARILGLKQKGHLGRGADADLVLYEEEPDAQRMFAYPRYVLKGGEIVLEEGELRRSVDGQTTASRPQYDVGIEKELAPRFSRRYAMAWENYPIVSDQLPGLQIQDCG
ncbi:MAG: formylmethanofuran dehydrogenase subunit A [Bacteroidales bacterium]|nr:formylmethanofuran dehydrogenase subunit A [Bacteroidales bacterium]